MNKSDFIPPLLTRALSRYNFLKKYGWFGNYSSWADALKHSEGYQSAQIAEKVKNAALKVKNGEAVYERDSVLFEHIEYSWPVLASLLWIANQKEGKLSVLDFGGSLGSTYFQNKNFFGGVKTVQWNVVEQDHFVKMGKEHFENDQLRFFANLSDCFRSQAPSTVLFSCVLQYLESPYAVLEQVLKFKPEFLLVDHMPFQSKNEDRIMVQKVSPDIYPASYPCWILNRAKFVKFFEHDYLLVSDFKSELFIKIDGVLVPYEGFIFRRK